MRDLIKVYQTSVIKQVRPTGKFVQSDDYQADGVIIDTTHGNDYNTAYGGWGKAYSNGFQNKTGESVAISYRQYPDPTTDYVDYVFPIVVSGASVSVYILYKKQHIEAYWLVSFFNGNDKVDERTATSGWETFTNVMPFDKIRIGAYCNNSTNDASYFCALKIIT